MDTVTHDWATLPKFTTSAFAYVCEDRRPGAAPTESYRHASSVASPFVTSAATAEGSAGATLLTITGSNFPTEEGDVPDVRLGGQSCEVLNRTSDGTAIVARVPSSVPPGVLPLALTSSLGNFGPRQELVVSVGMAVYNVTPARGSVGGGSVVTVHGAHFPTDASTLTVTLKTTRNVTGSDGNASLVTTASVCTPIAEGGTEEVFRCTVGAMDPSKTTLTRYGTPGLGRTADLEGTGEAYAASVGVAALLTGFDDKLRVMSQQMASSAMFPENQRSGVYVRNGATGVEAMAANADWSVMKSYGLGAMLYDPKTRAVVTWCHINWLYATGQCRSGWTSVAGQSAPSDLITMFEQASPEHLLIVETYRYLYCNLNNGYDAIWRAFESCGGSATLGVGMPAITPNW